MPAHLKSRQCNFAAFSRILFCISASTLSLTLIILRYFAGCLRVSAGFNELCASPTFSFHFQHSFSIIMPLLTFAFVCVCFLHLAYGLRLPLAYYCLTCARAFKYVLKFTRLAMQVFVALTPPQWLFLLTPSHLSQAIENVNVAL